MTFNDNKLMPYWYYKVCRKVVRAPQAQKNISQRYWLSVDFITIVNQQFVKIKTDSNDIIKSELPVKYVFINMFIIMLYGYAACCTVA